ncbi:MAG: hypothetical protein HZA14_10540 [Nitrospirae bacterium]|nr:hypothetical protein [Nitrospirota bacterium]
MTASFILASPLYAGAYDRIPAEGSAVVIGDKKDVARDKAVNAAFRKAVEQLIEVMVDADSALKNSELLRTKIYSQTFKYIKNHKVLEETVEGSALKLKLEANVKTDDLEKDLVAAGIRLKRGGKPKILLLISEQDMMHDKPSYWWSAGSELEAGTVESVLVEELFEKGFTLADRQVILKGIKKEPSFAGNLDPNLNTDAAVTLASMAEADVIITGQAVVKAGSRIVETSLHSCQANVSARVINADNDEVIASFSTNAVAAHVNTATGGAYALKKAAAEMADKLTARLSKWKKRPGITKTIRLVVSGLASDDMTDFKRFLKENVRGLVDISERGYSGGLAKLDLEITGGVKEAAEELNNKMIHTGMIAITSSVGNFISIKILSM